MSIRTAPILLWHVATQTDVDAELLYDVSFDELREIDSLWITYLALGRYEMIMRDEPLDTLPDSKGWEWAAKLRLAIMERRAWRFFAIQYRSFLQGAIVISTKPAECMAQENMGMKALGVEYLSAAPWNLGRFMRTLRREPYLQEVGPNLMRVAISLSQATECDGRIYLHSVQKAARFYRDKCGMIDLGMVDVNGEVLGRFEMSSQQAAVYMRG